MEKIVWILMIVLLTLLIIMQLKRMIEEYKVDRELKKASKELEIAISKRLDEMEQEDEEIEVLD